MESKGATTLFFKKASIPFRERISAFVVHGLHVTTRWYWQKAWLSMTEMDYYRWNRS